MILFDKQMIGKEWEVNQLTQKCRHLLNQTVKYCEFQDYHIYLTCVYRSDEEQRILYEKIGQPYAPSVHSQWRGFDFRIFPDAQFNQWLTDKVNTMFPYDPSRPEKVSLLRHVGSGDHFHGQTLT